jgi:hypothetical protein
VKPETSGYNIGDDNRGKELLLEVQPAEEGHRAAGEDAAVFFDIRERGFPALADPRVQEQFLEGSALGFFKFVVA